MYMQFPASEQLDSHIFLVGIMLLFNFIFLFFLIYYSDRKRRG